MGGCFSSRRKPGHAGLRSPARDPPPESDSSQEEKVKEVLSETPKPRVKATEEVKKEDEVGIEKGEADLGLINGCDDRSEEASDVYSLSESISVSTSLTDKRVEDEGDVEEKRRVESSPVKFQRKRSVSGEFHAKKERNVGVGVGVGCRSGRSSPLPVRKTDGSIGRTSSARESGPRSRVPPSNGFRRDPGERSGRRSLSPAMKRAADQRVAGGGQCRSLSSSSRVNGRSSPQRITTRAPDGGGGGGRRGQDGNNTGGGTSEAAKESLENPLVSLECFIFL